MFDVNMKVIGKDQMEDPSVVPTITRWTPKVYRLHFSRDVDLCAKILQSCIKRQLCLCVLTSSSSPPGSSWSASWRTTVSSSRTETSTSTSRCSSLEGRLLLGRRRSTMSSFIFLSRYSTNLTNNSPPHDFDKILPFTIAGDVQGLCEHRFEASQPAHLSRQSHLQTWPVKLHPPACHRWRGAANQSITFRLNSILSK